MPYSNSCFQRDGEPDYYGTGTIVYVSGVYKSNRIYMTAAPDATVDETNIEERNEEYNEEHGEDIWCIECDSREAATVICDALNSGVIVIHPPKVKP